MTRVVALIVALAWLVADYVTKQWALAALAQDVIVVNNFMSFVLAFNPGAAFSFMADYGGSQRWILAVFALFISVWLIYTIVMDEHSPIVLLAYGSILGGALGNMIDRIALIDDFRFASWWGHIDNPKRGEVIDFILWHYDEYSWPVFNIADVAISLGVFLLITYWIKGWFSGGIRWDY